MGLNIPLSTSSQLMIGRKRGELIIDDPLMSSSHARIFYREDGWYIQDLGSTNGTMVEDKFIKEVKLQPGVEISIGSSKMAIFVGLNDLKNDPQGVRTTNARLEIAWLLDEELVRLSSESTLSATDVIDNALRVPPSLNAVIEVIAGQDQGKVFRCTTGNINIGRKTGEVALSDQEVSRRHAIIEMFGKEMIFLRDLESTNGSFHNGRKVSTARLQNGDSIGIGRTVLRLRINS